MKLKPEIKTLWLDAMRSGEYKRCNWELRVINPDTKEFHYCCLGVLTDLYAKAHDKTFEEVQRRQEPCGLLTEEVVTWATGELSPVNIGKNVLFNTGHGSCADINDSKVSPLQGGPINYNHVIPLIEKEL